MRFHGIRIKIFTIPITFRWEWSTFQSFNDSFYTKMRKHIDPKWPVAPNEARRSSRWATDWRRESRPFRRLSPAVNGTGRCRPRSLRPAPPRRFVLVVGKHTAIGPRRRASGLRWSNPRRTVIRETYLQIGSWKVQVEGYSGTLLKLRFSFRPLQNKKIKSIRNEKL